jgi:hypothetical protein
MLYAIVMDPKDERAVDAIQEAAGAVDEPYYHSHVKSNGRVY